MGVPHLGGRSKVRTITPSWIGVAEVRDHIESNRYALLRLLNTTYKFSNASAAEMSAIRTMVLQNRLVLDLLTASSGGVCKMVGDTCCTFIPDGTIDGQDISTALHNLTGLQAYVKSQWWILII
uniref:ERVV2 protein n=1 Tax=Oryzias latipes TaxID=8090 RepID=A0A3P9LH59_ORYLA